jgi:hypothetical protein
MIGKELGGWGLDKRILGGKRQKKIIVEVKVIKSIAPPS